MHDFENFRVLYLFPKKTLTCHSSHSKTLVFTWTLPPYTPTTTKNGNKGDRNPGEGVGSPSEGDCNCRRRGRFGPDGSLKESRGRGLLMNASLPLLLLLCFFHAVDEALPPLIFLLPPTPLLLTFEIWTERWVTCPCLPGRLTKAAAATALCSWEEEEKEWGTLLMPLWDSWPGEPFGVERRHARYFTSSASSPVLKYVAESVVYI